MPGRLRPRDEGRLQRAEVRRRRRRGVGEVHCAPSRVRRRMEEPSPSSIIRVLGHALDVHIRVDTWESARLRHPSLHVRSSYDLQVRPHALLPGSAEPSRPAPCASCMTTATGPRRGDRASHAVGLVGGRECNPRRHRPRSATLPAHEGSYRPPPRSVKRSSRVCQRIRCACAARAPGATPRARPSRRRRCRRGARRESPTRSRGRRRQARRPSAPPGLRAQSRGPRPRTRRRRSPG